MLDSFLQGSKSSHTSCVSPITYEAPLLILSIDQEIELEVHLVLTVRLATNSWTCDDLVDRCRDPKPQSSIRLCLPLVMLRSKRVQMVTWLLWVDPLFLALLSDPHTRLPYCTNNLDMLLWFA